MSEIKWIKLSIDIFNDEAVELIEQMPEGDAILLIWFKLLIKAGQVNDNGLIYVKENIPYTEEMLSVIFKKPLTTIKLALNTFQKFGMIRISSTNEILLTNWNKYQNVTGMEKIRQDSKKRVERFREKRKLKLIEGGETTMPNPNKNRPFSFDEKTEELLKKTGASDEELKEYIERFELIPTTDKDSKNTTSRLVNFVKKLHKEKVELDKKNEQRQKAAAKDEEQRQKTQKEMLELTKIQEEKEQAICDKESAIEYLKEFYGEDKFLSYSSSFKELSKKYDFTLEEVQNVCN